jgi:erythromycin esterase-like protein
VPTLLAAFCLEAGPAASCRGGALLPTALIDDLRDAAQLLTDGEAGDYDTLLELVGEAHMVLLGVASYGTHELFHARSEVTKRLIEDRGFTALAVGTDPRAAKRIDDFVRHASDHALAIDALSDFNVFPKWLWRNAEMLDFVGWLRNYNTQFSGDVHKVGVCGLDEIDRPKRSVVWEHSRQVSDSRATDSQERSLGQLARERHGRAAVLVGFSTYAGTVVAAADRDLPPRRQHLRPPPPNSIEAVCHALEIPRFFLPLRGASDRLIHGLRELRPERMVDVVFRPEADSSGCIRARLADQFDALVYFDETRSLEPLDSSSDV